MFICYVCCCCVWLFVSFVELQSLDLSPGVEMEVYVTEVINPHHFIVQPQSSVLVEIMKAMG